MWTLRTSKYSGTGCISLLRPCCWQRGRIERQTILTPNAAIFTSIIGVIPSLSVFPSTVATAQNRFRSIPQLTHDTDYPPTTTQPVLIFEKHESHGLNHVESFSHSVAIISLTPTSWPFLRNATDPLRWAPQSSHGGHLFFYGTLEGGLELQMDEAAS